MASVMSGKAGRQSAIWSGQQAAENLGHTIPLYEEGWAGAKKALGKGYGASGKYLTSGYKGFRRDIGRGMETARGDLTSGYGQAIGALQDAYGNAIPVAQQGADAWKQNLDRANVGYSMYSNALGLGGEEGRRQALAAFQEGPGYQYSVDEATQQAQRAANRLGSAYGGNQQVATQRLANNLANQEWGNWINNLQGYQGAAGTATAGYAGQLNNVAKLYQSQGQDLGGMYANQGKDLAAAAQWGYGKLGEGAYQYGQDKASLATNYYTGLANASTGRANDLVGAWNRYYDTIIPAGQQGLMAGQQAAANRMGMLGGFAQMGMQALGGFMGGGGGMFGSMFKGG